MAGIKDALRSRLTGFAGVQDLVTGRVSSNVLPQGSALPAVVFQRISKITAAAHSDIPGSERLVRSRWQLTCWAADGDTAETLGDQVSDALHGYRGTIAGVRIDAALAQADAAQREPDSGRHRRILDFFIWHTE